MKLSIIAPVFNEEGSLRELHQSIVSVCETSAYSFEVIFVNDGSKDGSLEIMKQLSPLKIINLRRNFGQTAAMDAGVREAKGDIIITMDSDLQNDPMDIPLLLNELDKGYDVVSGWRKKRQDSSSKKMISRGANFLRKILIDDGIHDSGCTLKAYRRECFENLDLFGEMHRFIPALMKIRGFKIGEVEVNHHPRTSGKTKYGFKRTVKGFLDLLSVWFWKKYSSRPLHLFGGVGFCIIIISFLAIIVAFCQKLFYQEDLSGNALTIISFFGLMVGIQFFIFGLLMDIAVKTYYRTGREKYYEMKEIIER